jgi:hypothetical protein
VAGPRGDAAERGRVVGRLAVARGAQRVGPPIQPQERAVDGGVPHQGVDLVAGLVDDAVGRVAGAAGEPAVLERKERRQLLVGLHVDRMVGAGGVPQLSAVQHQAVVALQARTAPGPGGVGVGLDEGGPQERGRAGGRERRCAVERAQARRIGVQHHEVARVGADRHGVTELQALVARAQHAHQAAVGPEHLHGAQHRVRDQPPARRRGHRGRSRERAHRQALAPVRRRGLAGRRPPPHPSGQRVDGGEALAVGLDVDHPAQHLAVGPVGHPPHRRPLAIEPHEAAAAVGHQQERAPLHHVDRVQGLVVGPPRVHDRDLGPVRAQVQQAAGLVPGPRPGHPHAAVRRQAQPGRAPHVHRREPGRDAGGRVHAQHAAAVAVEHQRRAVGQQRHVRRQDRVQRDVSAEGHLHDRRADGVIGQPALVAAHHQAQDEGGAGGHGPVPWQARHSEPSVAGSARRASAPSASRGRPDRAAASGERAGAAEGAACTS